MLKGELPTSGLRRQQTGQQGVVQQMPDPEQQRDGPSLERLRSYNLEMPRSSWRMQRETSETVKRKSRDGTPTHENCPRRRQRIREMRSMRLPRRYRRLEIALHTCRHCSSSSARGVWRLAGLFISWTMQTHSNHVSKQLKARRTGRQRRRVHLEHRNQLCLRTRRVVYLLVQDGWAPGGSVRADTAQPTCGPGKTIMAGS